MAWVSREEHHGTNVPAEVTDAAIAAFAKHGMTVVIDPRSNPDEPVLVEPGLHRFYGLGSLISVCRTEPAAEWPGIIEAHVGSVFRASTEYVPPSRLPAEDLHALVRTRIVTASAAARSDLTYAREFAGDLYVALALDLPETVAMLSPRDVEDIDTPIDELYRIGQANTNVEVVEEHAPIESGSNVWAMSGDSFFIASQVADMAALVENRIRSAPLGVVFGIPDRSVVFYTAPRDKTALDDITTVVDLTDRFANRYPEPPGRLSPVTFYWDEGTITMIGGRDKSGDLIVDGSGPFGSLLEMIAVMNKDDVEPS